MQRLLLFAALVAPFSHALQLHAPSCVRRSGLGSSPREVAPRPLLLLRAVDDEAAGDDDELSDEFMAAAYKKAETKRKDLDRFEMTENLKTAALAVTAIVAIAAFSQVEIGEQEFGRV